MIRSLTMTIVKNYVFCYYSTLEEDSRLCFLGYRDLNLRNFLENINLLNYKIQSEKKTTLSYLTNANYVRPYFYGKPNVLYKLKNKIKFI